jgi:hypothetical protein
MRQVLDGSEPILLVSHDAEDHGWQFIGTSDASMADAKLVCLEEIARLDPTVLEVADLPPGWQAIRNAVGGAWTRREHPPVPEESIRAAGQLFANVETERHGGLDIYPDGPVSLRLPIQFVGAETNITAQVAVSYMACKTDGVRLRPVERCRGPSSLFVTCGTGMPTAAARSILCRAPYGSRSRRSNRT